eukprot:15479720-Alexandrium_andersonii.AAC.1
MRRNANEDDEEHPVPLSFFLALPLLPEEDRKARMESEGPEQMSKFSIFFKDALALCAKFKFPHG